MSRAPLARRVRARTLCRIAPRSTSAQVRLKILGGARSVKRSPSEAGFEDVEGEDVHAGDDPDQPVALDDGQYFPASLGHDGRGLAEGRLGGDGGHFFRHDLADGDAGALEGLPAVFLRASQGHEAAEDVEEARRLYVRVLKDEVALGDYPDETPIAHDYRGAGDPGLGEEFDRV